MKKTNKIKVVELFAGVGGFRVGLERASKNFEVIWSNQWEPNKTKQWAFNCYQEHFGKSMKHINKDINSVINEVPDHDLLVGGFPCQDYSVARTNAEGIEGKKGILWWSIISIIETKKPKFIILENVDRLLRSPSKQRGRDFGIMLRTLNDAGYNAEWRVINAADYGNAQRRKRIFIFAYKKIYTEAIWKIWKKDDKQSTLFLNGAFPILREKNLKKENVFSIISEFENLADVSDNFKNTFFNNGCMLYGIIQTKEVEARQEKSTTLWDVLEKVDVDENLFINDHLTKFQYLKGSKKIQRLKPNGEKYFYSEGAMNFPDSLFKPARTILTSEGSINRSTHVVVDFKSGNLRMITPVEAERLNGFDDNWTNTGMPEKFRYFCMGNALVVPIIERIGKQLILLWNELENE